MSRVINQAPSGSDGNGSFTASVTHILNKQVYHIIRGQIWGQLHYVNSNYLPITDTNSSYTLKHQFNLQNINSNYQFHIEINICEWNSCRNTQCLKIKTTPIPITELELAFLFWLQYNWVSLSRLHFVIMSKIFEWLSTHAKLEYINNFYIQPVPLL